MRYVSKGDGLAFWLSVLLAVVGLFAAFWGEMPWWPGTFFAACAAVFVLWRMLVDLPSYGDDLEISDQGIRRTYGPRLRRKKREAISWDALSKVEIMTGGSDSEDVFLLYGPDDAPMVVSDSVADVHELLWELQRRLPGFDERQVENAYKACRRAEDGRALVWQRPAAGSAS